jgi:hypothetical protein
MRRLMENNKVCLSGGLGIAASSTQLPALDGISMLDSFSYS